jgi:hypothetical protein
LWDGVYAGLMELINNRVNQCRAAIVFTNGRDSISHRSIDELILLANRNLIRIITIGLGDSIESTLLERLANLTGGRYYETPGPAQLANIFKEISTIFGNVDYECMITYTAKCKDGSLRTVDLSLLNFCGWSSTVTRTYKALRDTTTFEPLNIRLGRKVARGNTTVTIPLELTAPFTTNEVFNSAEWSVKFDTTRLRFLRVETPPGRLLNGVPIAVTPIADGVSLKTTDRKTVGPDSLPAVLADLVFMTGNPETKDTVNCPLTLSNWRFDAGCFQPVLQDGMITILPAVNGVDASVENEKDFIIGPIHPNPIRSSASVPFVLPERTHIRILVTDALGRQVRILADEWMDAGRHSIEFNAAGLPPGVYLCRMEAGGKTTLRKMIIN